MERETRSQSVEHVWCAKPPLSRLPLFKIDVIIPILQMKQLRLSKVKSPIQGRSANLPQNEDFNSSLMIQKPGSEAAAVTDKARSGGGLSGSREQQMCRPSRETTGPASTAKAEGPDMLQPLPPPAGQTASRWRRMGRTGLEGQKASCKFDISTSV